MVLLQGCGNVPWKSTPSSPEQKIRIDENSLTSSLVQSLGVTTKQAEGGAGALLDVAENTLSKADFSKIVTAIPDAGSLLETTSTMGGTLASSGGSSKLIDGYNHIKKQFESLGLNSSMISSFISVMVQYLGKGDDSTPSDLLQSALSTALSGSAGSLINSF